jgi:uncharacterized protein (DUF305 family)
VASAEAQFLQPLTLQKLAQDIFNAQSREVGEMETMLEAP